jgi:mono/diheme cytochrome c family protein
MTYEVEGKQYVAVLSSFGGSIYLGAGFLTVVPGLPINSRLNVFTLDGKGAFPSVEKPVVSTPRPPQPTASAAEVARGAQLYANHCQNCHGVGAWSTGVLPELRRSMAVHDPEVFNEILSGALLPNGMPKFSTVLVPADREAIRAYIIQRATYLYEAEQVKSAR